MRDHTKIGTARELFFALSEEIARELQAKGLSEEEIVADFQAWRKSKRAETGQRDNLRKP